MVRQFEAADLEQVMALWLAANLQAHEFIPKEYWLSHFDEVKKSIPDAQVFVYENQHRIQGFVGLADGYIAGIFVSSDEQSKGIGKLLLDECKRLHPVLTLHVYEKNSRAIDFYLREGFRLERQMLDEGTGEKEYGMVWRSGGISLPENS